MPYLNSCPSCKDALHTIVVSEKKMFDNNGNIDAFSPRAVVDNFSEDFVFQQP